MKPIIGVTPLWDDKLDSLWMLPGYVDAITKAGGLPIIFPLKASREDILQLCDMCDGFLLTGGDDINPALYNQQPRDKTETSNVDRDFLESEVFSYAIEHNKSVLGICRGIQLINALCGGTLYQDLPTEYDILPAIDHVNHEMTPPYDKHCHRVRVLADTPLAALVDNAEWIGVNSYHHQAIKTLAPNLEAMAISEDGIVEAVYMPSKTFVQAVQWHPEFNFHCDDNSSSLFASFVASL